MPKIDDRLARIEAKRALIELVAAAPRPSGRRDYGEMLLDLLASKLEASAALAVTVRQLLDSPAWASYQDPEALATLGQWLDESALAFGDRLAAQAHHAPHPPQPAQELPTDETHP